MPGLSHKRPVAIVPCFNEAEGEIRATLAEWTPFCDVILVDDGSAVAVSSLGFSGISVVRHQRNQGQGAAIRSGLAAALKSPAVHFLTVDADGQHPASNLPVLLDSLMAGADVVFGSRFLGGEQALSTGRFYFLKLAKVFNNFITGLDMSDAHNGLRAMNRQGAEALLEITESGMAHASEIPILVRKRKLRWVEVPVNIRYSAYSLGKGQSFWRAFPLLFKLLGLKMKYAKR